MFPYDQERARQFLEYDEWLHACLALGATDTQCGDYERAARAFAQTTIYPNSAVVATARKAALDALRAGEPMPADVEAAVKAAFARELGKLLGVL